MKEKAGLSAGGAYRRKNTVFQLDFCNCITILLAMCLSHHGNFLYSCRNFGSVDCRGGS